MGEYAESITTRCACGSVSWMGQGFSPNALVSMGITHLPSGCYTMGLAEPKMADRSVALAAASHVAERDHKLLARLEDGPRIFPHDRSPVAAVLLLVGAVAWLGLIVALGCLMGIAR